VKKEIRSCTGFDWDEWNIDHVRRHGVSVNECEQVFFKRPLYKDDPEHSDVEKRYIALGSTDQKRFLFVSFTIRNHLFRVITARDMNQKERRAYNEKIKRDSRAKK
jgi:uncharacterized DUF497 family protein